MVWLSDGEKSLRICILVWTEYTNVTDRRTDEQTDTTQRHKLRYAQHRATIIVQRSFELCERVT